jgi:hypothetical protein
MAKDTTPKSIQDWTAVAQNTIAESAVEDVSPNYGSMLYIQAFLDTITAHTGTKFVVQASNADSGDEDWYDFTEFVELIGTAATDLIENNPLAASSTAIALTGHALTVLGKWLGIEDGTLINSELIFEKSQITNEVVILDGTTNAHALNTAIFNVAMTKLIFIPPEIARVRVVINNAHDADGSTLNYKVGISEILAVS